MSNNQDNLEEKLQNTSIGGNSKPAQGSFNPNAASTFVPGQSYGGYNQYQPNQYQPNHYQQGYQPDSYQQGGYQQSYGSYNQYQQGGYQQPGAYQYQQGGYQSYNPQPAQTGMSLADFQKQQQEKLNSQPAKPKKTLKLAGSSTIKLANASKPVKKDEPKAEPKAEPKVEPKVETPEPKAETEAETKPEPKAEVTKQESKPEPKKEEKKAPKESTPAPVEDIVDEEVVRDLFGGKDHVSIMFMGHVDAGKSTMGGNILFLTDAVDKRTVEKYQKEAIDAGRQGWYLSWIMDTNKEERSDGKTIEVGKAYFETEKRRYTILDAPGHKMYVSEMIGGASQADVGILVISARKGEYETGFERGGQTREHALLAKTQGVNKIVVAVNKMDDPTVNWSEQRYKECTTKLGMYLKGIGYNKDDIVYMPVSGYTGAGLKDRIKSSECSWYKGPSLLEWLDNMKTVDRKINGPFMLPISGKLKDMGLVIEGKIESGHVKRNQQLLMMPNKAKIEVTTVYNETEEECEQAFSGEQVRLKIKGVEEEDVQPGYVLTSPDKPVKTISKFEAQVAIVELKSILSNGFSCVMHVHNAIEEIKFVELKHKLEKGTNRKSKKPPAFAKKGMKVIAVLEVAAPVCAERYADYPQLGRFTLRDQGVTIAIGKITKILE
ncbi:eukaryotic peptide chain release factor GTP-binding subunit [[Candida] jaroonii]|uniref:Eukaryotic peptide chain release factor GTP-binding subunit n=1 Tax=[Candida] jaroonii TaxID=467808 RepID=A0ACA9Y0D8_9ASCO|nr:eukaryotic peptide chain release factor GTP-binding subunit [[Candida] jaroonii]